MTEPVGRMSFSTDMTVGNKYNAARGSKIFQKYFIAVMVVCRGDVFGREIKIRRRGTIGRDNADPSPQI